MFKVVVIALLNFVGERGAVFGGLAFRQIDAYERHVDFLFRWLAQCAPEQGDSRIDDDQTLFNR